MTTDVITKKESLPYGIDFVISEDLPDIKRYATSQNTYLINCPFCHGKRKMNVHLGKNVCRCAKCGESGNLITIHRKLRHLESNKLAFEDLNIRFKQLSDDTQQKINLAKKESDDFVETKPAYLNVRDWVYQNLIACLELKDKHKNDLLKRGLTLEQIKKNGYRSYPEGDTSEIVQKIFGSDCKGDLPGHKQGYIGLPGFYDELLKTKIIAGKNGYLIPVVTKEGKISCFQIRHDPLNPKASKFEKEMYHKYSYFTSVSKKTGSSVTGCENIHYTGFKRLPITKFSAPKTVWLTEGCLKADVASALSGFPFIAVLGVNNTNQLLNNLIFLKENGVECINIAFDMDYREKPEVQKALLKVIDIIKESNLKCNQINWDSKYKGIDDFFNVWLVKNITYQIKKLF